MNERKLLVQRIGLVGITNLFLQLNNLLLLPILTKNIPVEDYGVWVQVVVTVGLVPGVIMLGLPSAMFRFLSSAKDRDEIQEIFYTIILALIIPCTIATILIFAFSEPIASAIFDGETSIVKLLSLIIFLECFNNIFSNYFRIFDQIKKYSLITIMRFFFNISLAIYFVFKGYGVYGAVAALLITALLQFLIMTVIVTSQIGVKMPTFKKLRDFLAFGLPVVVGSLSSSLLGSSDRYVIGLFLGTAFVGYYSPGYTLGNIINMIISPLAFMLPSVLPKHYDGDNIKEVKIILSYSMKYYLALALPSAFGLALLSRSILTLISTPSIASEGYLITPFTALGAIFFGAYAIVSQILLLEKKVSLVGWIWILAAVSNLILNILLVPMIGILGAAISALLAYAFVFALNYYYSRKILVFYLDSAFILKSILASILMSLIILAYPPSGKESLLAVIGACAIFYFVVLVLLKGFKNEEIDVFRSMFRI